MCTVTYLPLKGNDFILTSSRDVPFSREKSLRPKEYIEDGITLSYPKDGKAGGTWIGTSSRKRLVCLLNGGFKNHQQKEFYVKSRGVIVKELLKADDISTTCNLIDLDQVEPFTLVIVEWNLTSDKTGSNTCLSEFVWDGENKHFRILAQEPQIWSSSTLYTEGMKEMREKWFSDWKNRNEFKKESILQFHHQAGIGDKDVDVLMNRCNVGTVSITVVSKNKNIVKMQYEEIDH